MNPNNITELRSQLCKVAQEVNEAFGDSDFNEFAEACEELNKLQERHIALVGKEFEFEEDSEWEDYQCALHVAEEALKGQGELP